MCQAAAEEALNALKRHGPGGISVVKQSIVDCLAACTVCDRWKHADKGFFSMALEQDLLFMGEKLENMEKNWYHGDPEVAKVRKDEAWKRYAESGKRQEWLDNYKRKKEEEKNVQKRNETEGQL